MIFVVTTSDLSLFSRLRTTSRSSAQKAATILSARLDEQWLMLRIKHNQSPASQLLVEAEHKSELPLISEILERYLDTKGHGKAELFFVHAKRNIGHEPLRLEIKVLICTPRRGLRAAHSSRLAPAQLNLRTSLSNSQSARLGNGQRLCEPSDVARRLPDTHLDHSHKLRQTRFRARH